MDLRRYAHGLAAAVMLLALAVAPAARADTILIADTGDVALNGTAPSDGDSLTTGGWLANGQTNENTGYSDTVAFSGALSLRTTGYNMSGAHALLGTGYTSLTAQVQYLTKSNDGADTFWLRSTATGKWLALRAGAFGNTVAPFDFTVYDPSTGAYTVLPIAGCPSYGANRWYSLQIAVEGTAAALFVSDGTTTGVATYELDQAIAFDEVRFGVDRFGGGSHSAYWDDVYVTTTAAPVPEPVGVSLVLLGAASVLGARRRAG